MTAMGVYIKNVASTSYAETLSVEGSTSGNLGIDKVTIVAQVSESDLVHYENYRKTIHFAKEAGFDVTWDGRARANGYRNSARISIKGCPAKDRPLLQFDPYNKKQGFLRLEFNPNRLGSQGIWDLKTWMDFTSPHGWPAMREWGRVTRIDVNLDFPIPIQQYIWDSRYSVTRERFLANGRQESIYLGKKEWGKGYTKIYDWNACHDQFALAPKTRVERKHIPDCGLKALPQMSNPFQGMRAYRMFIPPFKGYTFGMWQLYLEHLSKVGLRNGLFSFDISERSAIRQYVKSHQATELDFKGVWESWPDVVDELGLSSPGPHGPKIPFIDASVPKDLLGQA